MWVVGGCGGTVGGVGGGGGGAFILHACVFVRACVFVIVRACVCFRVCVCVCVCVFTAQYPAGKNSNKMWYVVPVLLFYTSLSILNTSRFSVSCQRVRHARFSLFVLGIVVSCRDLETTDRPSTENGSSEPASLHFRHGWSNR